jgi:hypothetical protein
MAWSHLQDRKLQYHPKSHYTQDIYCDRYSLPLQLSVTPCQFTYSTDSTDPTFGRLQIN